MRFSMRFSQPALTVLVGLTNALAGIASASAADQAEPGLVAEYFAMNGGVGDFPKVGDQKPFLVRIDKQVDYENVEGGFYGTKLSENFYARWTGVLHIEKAGEYTFITESDDGSRLSLDDKQVVDNGGPHAMTKKAGKVELSAGDHQLKAEYFQGGGGAGCRISWVPPGGNESIIPASALLHAKGADEQIAWDKAAWKKAKGPSAGGGGGGGANKNAWYYLMDYGPVLADSISAPWPKDNLACKGLAVKFTSKDSEKKDVNAGGMLFDTDLLRMAAGWTDGFLEFRGVAYDGAHGVPGPKVSGTLVFGTPAAPGWSKGDSFTDPRSEPFGPLPAEWAKFKGHYLSGDKVVFSYTVGAGSVLEQPLLEADGKVLSRNFQISGFAAASTMVVCELPDATGTVEGALAQLKSAEHALSATLIGAPAGVSLAVEGERLLMKVPALKGPAVFKLAVAGGEAAAAGALLKAAAPASDPAALTKGGPARWTESIETKGELGSGDGPYLVDTITVPEENPYKAKMRFGGFDFFSDGRAAVSTWNGDVWVVTGIDDKLEKLSWKRFATGLHQALGLKVVDDLVYVTTRTGLIRLHDLNKDGEADFYEAFNNDVHTTPAFHEFAFDLQTDPQGNFYYAKAGPVRAGGRGWERIGESNGCMFKISKDGTKSEVFATGFRAPNGMSVGPNGEVTSGDNEGTWTPTSRVNLVEKGGFYGVPDLAHRKEMPTDYDKPILWLPHGGIDNSCGGQAWVSGEKWGLPKGQLLHLSYGTCSLFLVAWGKEGTTAQGGATRFPLNFNTGTMRARFNAKDGQLYICGLKGWQTTGAKDAGFQRVRYTGKPVHMITGMAVRKNGLSLTFSSPLDRAAAGDKSNYSAEEWNYLWTGNYGSPEVHVHDPKKNGHDGVDITSATLSADGKTVFLEIPSIEPVMQLKLKFKIAGADGTVIQQDFYSTVNKLGEKSGP